MLVLRHWQLLVAERVCDELCRHTGLSSQAGHLEIDNNLIETAIRPSALGKKNWLFIGHPEAGERSAVIYTLLGSCRRHGLNPFDYLKDLFTRLPSAKITEIRQFTPAAWAEARTRQKLTAQSA